MKIIKIPPLGQFLTQIHIVLIDEEPLIIFHIIVSMRTFCFPVELLLYNGLLEEIL